MAKLITLQSSDLINLPTPEATATWQPIAHNFVRDTLASSLFGANYGIIDEQISVAEDFLTATGKFSLEAQNGTWGTEVVWMNDHKKRKGLTFGIGERTFVCCNGCIFAEYTMKTKRTGRVLRRVEIMASEVVQLIEAAQSENHDRRVHFSETLLGPEKAALLTIEAARAGIVPSSKILPVLEEFDSPSFNYEHRNHSVMGLQSAITHTLKAYSAIAQNDRSKALTGLLDSFCAA